MAERSFLDKWTDVIAKTPRRERTAPMPTNRKVAAVPDERKAIYERFIRPAISPHPYEDDGRGSTENLIDNILTARREAAAEATEQLKLIADKIEKLAFVMPAPNEWTPQFIMLVNAIRAKSPSPSASRDRESKP